jgi:hypothetical protein
MKIDKVKNETFAPITLTIVLESQDEVDCLTAVFNSSVNDICKANPEVTLHTGVLGGMQFQLWKKISPDSTQDK